MSKGLETKSGVLRIEDIDASSDPQTALVFLHYWGGSAATWRKVIADLHTDVRCVALNQRGWGGSGVTDDRYDLYSMAADVHAVIAELGLRRVILVGHSMGGKVAQIVAMTKPPEVRGLVLVAPAPPTAMPVPAEVRRAMLQSYQTEDGVEQALLNLAGPALGADDRRGVVTDTLAGAPGAKSEWTERGMIADLGLASDDIDVPVTVLVGSLDKVEQPSRLRTIFGEVVPQSRFIEMPGIGHLIPLEAPAAISSACRDMLTIVAG